MTAALVIFAKEPAPGRVKTRLCPPFTPEQAADFYAALLEDVLSASAAFAAGRGVTPILALDTAAACRAFAARAPAGMQLTLQRGDGLAARMEHATAAAFSAGFAPVLLRSSDSPGLDCATLEAAVRALARAELVVCPDQRGGYVLVGLARPAPGLFDHPMSTRTVLEDTLTRARARGLRITQLPASFDINTAQDLHHLRALPTTSTCAATSRAWLDQRIPLTAV